MAGAQRIFVAGTGRSGTTVMQALLASHPAIHGIPEETRFIVEGDGLYALLPWLSENFSVSQSDVALFRFLAMMGQGLPGFEDLARAAPPTGVAAPLQAAALARFVARVSAFTIAGYPNPRLFEDRAELDRVAADLVDEMFMGAARAAGKGIWAEKTPANLLAVDFLWRLFPDARVLHIKRDPRGVLHSLMRQSWAPQGLGPATALLWQIYWRWQQLRPRLGLPDRRYLELRLEDLVADPAGVMGQVAAWLGLPDRFDLSLVRGGADGWRQAMPADHRAHAERHLARAFALMGYAI